MEDYSIQINWRSINMSTRPSSLNDENNPLSMENPLATNEVKLSMEVSFSEMFNIELKIRNDRGTHTTRPIEASNGEAFHQIEMPQFQETNEQSAHVMLPSGATGIIGFTKPFEVKLSMEVSFSEMFNIELKIRNDRGTHTTRPIEELDPKQETNERASGAMLPSGSRNSFQIPRTE